MQRRHPVPRLWLMTDERQGDTLWRSIERLPRGAGIIFRHYSLEPSDRRRLFRLVRACARRRGLVLVLAGSPREARAWKADGSHGRGPVRTLAGQIRTAPAHNMREMRAAERAGADLMLLSPAFPTRSHPNVRTLGRVRFGLLARKARRPVIALGGMDAKRARTLPGIAGWAAIDAWS